MKLKVALSCPFCGSSLSLSKSYVTNEEDIIYGIVSCECSKYPILDGILVLRTDAITRWVVHAIEQGKYEAAFLHFVRWDTSIPLSLLHEDALSFLDNLLQIYSKSRKSKHILDSGKISFEETISKLGWGMFGNYLINRFSCHPFWNAYTVLPILKAVEGPLLDLGCGAGHSSFVLSHIKPQYHFCIDTNFLLLDLSRKYFSDAEHICVDGSSALPFSDNYFSAIFCLDCFHFISAKKLMVKEFQRILKHDGVAILPHLHNLLKESVSLGKGLTASGYQRLFADFQTELFTEDDLLTAFLNNEPFDFGRKIDGEHLDSAAAFTLIATNNQRLLREYPSAKQIFLDMSDCLVINPLFDVRKNNEKTYCLTRKTLRIGGIRNRIDRRFWSEFYITDSILPKTITLDDSLVEEVLNKSCPLTHNAIRQLKENFVLINVPDRYC